MAIIAMFFLFAMISFVTNLAAPIGTIWGYKFEGNSMLGMMGKYDELRSLSLYGYSCRQPPYTHRL